MSDAQTLNETWARAVIDALCEAGAADAVVCPGSRSTPLALACAAERRLRVHSIVDERSGAFFALGAAKATGKPAIVLATSGTAGAHFYPAVIEAEASRVPRLARDDHRASGVSLEAPASEAERS